MREQLKTQQVNTIVWPTDGGMKLRIRKATMPEPAHLDLYRKLGITSEIMRPHRSLAPAEEAPN